MMPGNLSERIAAALKLEEIQHMKAVEALNGECDAEVAKIIIDQASHGGVVSGRTAGRISAAHLKRAEKIIDNAILLRRASIERVPELAGELHTSKLFEELERTADTVCQSIPQHIARHTVGAGPRTQSDHSELSFEAIKLKAHAGREIEIMKSEIELKATETPTQTDNSAGGVPSEPQPDARRVFVVHGRNLGARDAMFTFLRSVNLDPIEWSEAVAFTGKGSPFIGQILDHAFAQAKAVVVLITGDDIARLGTRYLVPSDPPHETGLTAQARANVLFEAGMAFGRHPDRTILVSLGYSRPFSDVAGRHEVKINNRAEDRLSSIARLKTAGCDVRFENKTDWLNAGDFDSSMRPPDFGAADAPVAENTPSTPDPGPVATQNVVEDDDDVEFFAELRRKLAPNHTWTPEIGSKDDQVAKRLVNRGWLEPGQMGGYIIRRHF
jgi:predicted nucleotide-binding protein